MSLQYIIDAYNLINHPAFSPVKNRSQNLKISFLSFIRKHKLTGSTKNKIIIVFDGFEPSLDAPYSEEGVLFIYSRNISADEKIKMLIEESANRKQITVVSNDRQVQFMTGVLGAKFISIERFTEAINRNASKERGFEEDQKKNISFVQMQQINEELKARWLK